MSFDNKLVCFHGLWDHNHHGNIVFDHISIYLFINPSVHSYILYLMDIHIVIATVAMETVITAVLYFFINQLFYLYIHCSNYTSITIIMYPFHCIRRRKKRQMLLKTKRRRRESPSKQNLNQNWTNEFR